MRNRVKTASKATHQYINSNAANNVLAAETRNEEVSNGLLVEDKQASQVEVDEVFDEDDDSWLDDLTPFSSDEVAQAPQTVSSRAEPEEGEEGTEEQKKRLSELYATLEYADADLAAELDDKLVTPKIAELRSELEELKRHRQQEQQSRQSAVLADVNAKILSKYPKAERIFKSKEFMDYINTSGNPYASDTEFNLLMRAYHAGDADYVLRKLDGFMDARQKPKLRVGVEPQQSRGRVSNMGERSQKGKMTDAEYLAKRKAIKSAPKGTYPRNALKELVKEYMK